MPDLKLDDLFLANAVLEHKLVHPVVLAGLSRRLGHLLQELLVVEDTRWVTVLELGDPGQVSLDHLNLN